MIRHAVTTLLTLAAFATLAPHAAAQPGPGFGDAPEGPSLGATLYAEHAALAPGDQTTLAIQLDIESGWHIYHPIVLDTGMPTTATFELPDGLSTGPLQFPVPKYGESAGIAYLGHYGQPILLTTLTADEDVEPGRTVTIKVRVDALICNPETCIPIDAEATLELRIAAAPGEPQHGDLFARARDALPVDLSDATQLAGSEVVASHTQVPIGGKGELLVVLDIADNYHIQDRDPGNPDLIATRIHVGQPDGITVHRDQAKWPPAKVQEIPGFGEARFQKGRTIVRIPFEVTDPKAPRGPAEFPVLVEYQACSEEGQCLAPVTAAASAPVEIVAEGAAAVENARADDLVAEAQAAAISDISWRQLFGVLFFAFIGGMILNIMPCVLPVISLKIYGFVNQAGQSRKRIFAMGLTYAAGILVSFLPIAIAMVATQAAWGALIMQNATAIILLSGLMLALGLSMLDVFEFQLPGSASTAAAGATSREGYTGAFMNGVLTTILATPCTAPFLGSALGLLFVLPPIMAFAGIMVVGVGLAFPYLLLTAMPQWLKFLPKPGNWMVTFKHAMGVVILAVPLWLLWVLSAWEDAALLHGALIFLFGVGIACWIFGRLSLNVTWTRFITTTVVALGLMAGGWTAGPVYFGRLYNPHQPIDWQPWRPNVGPELAAEGKTVYIDYTAAWCLTCQQNKLLVLETPKVAGKLEEMGVVPIKADFTKQNAQIAAEIRAHGRNGVPVNVIYPADRPDEPIVLPEILTTRIVMDALKDAGPSEMPDPNAPDAEGPAPVAATP